MKRMEKLWQYLAVRIIKAVQKYGPHEVVVLGKKYAVTADVFNPKFYRTSEFMAENLRIDPEDDVLDMGTGSGILAISAGKSARKVIAVDINPQAVKCAGINIERHGLEKVVSVQQGDLFESLCRTVKFNVIIFAPPYLEGVPKKNLDYALYDPGKSLLKRFFEEAKAYLKPGGCVQMVYSSIAEPGRVLEMASENGWEWSMVARKKGLFETYLIWKFTPRIGKE